MDRIKIHKKMCYCCNILSFPFLLLFCRLV